LYKNVWLIRIRKDLGHFGTGSGLLAKSTAPGSRSASLLRLKIKPWRLIVEPLRLKNAEEAHS
jgi:hypothetical protein